MSSRQSDRTIHVNVVIPVFNASATIDEAVDSAMRQTVPVRLQNWFQNRLLDITVCCYNDGSTDDSWSKLEALAKKYLDKQKQKDSTSIILPPLGEAILQSTLLISTGSPSRGAPYARNQAIKLGPATTEDNLVLVWLDSDDVMHTNRVAEQVYALFQHPCPEKLLLGSHFVRDPPDSTWHYSKWACGLTDDRLVLERYREVTILQPTWCMLGKRFFELGGYYTGNSEENQQATNKFTASRNPNYLILPDEDNANTVRLAEDLRFFHAHLAGDGEVAVIRKPLVTYRHRAGQSQSSQTPRTLLLQLRTLAFEKTVLSRWEKFVVWGAGRDGKDFVKALSEVTRKKIVCMVDVDHKKIEIGHYVHKEWDVKIPIVHFSLLSADPKMREKLQDAYFLQTDKESGRIDKSKPKVERNRTTSCPPRKRFKVCAITDFDTGILPSLPVVVCVAMYRTNGALERNVASVGRTEGKDLWHFS
jgi:glycosyltransferase involved in cell wall biosynthesis